MKSRHEDGTPPPESQALISSSDSLSQPTQPIRRDRRNASGINQLQEWLWRLCGSVFLLRPKLPGNGRISAREQPMS